MTPPAAPPGESAVVRGLTRLLFFGQSTVSALVGAQLSGASQWAGVPATLYILGTASAAYPAARLMERYGRRLGLSGGFVLGLAGATVAGAAVVAHHFLFFLAGLIMMGAARGFIDLGRYAAAEMHPASNRGRAISLVVLGGTLGAIVGPELVGPMGRLLESLAADPLAGPFFASAGLFGLGGLLLFTFLRPDPRDLGRQLAVVEVPTAMEGPVRTLGAILRQPTAIAALSALVLGQAVMVMLMSMTPLHMRDHQHNLADIARVIQLHTLGMFGPSLISGRLVDRWGRAPVIVAGAVMLAASCLLAPLSTETWAIGLALLLLGLGWNFTYVAGGALLTDSLTPAERSRGQGSTDLLINVVSALGSLSSGLLFGTLGYGLISAVGLALSLVPLALAIPLARRAPAAAPLSGD